MADWKLAVIVIVTAAVIVLVALFFLYAGPKQAPPATGKTLVVVTFFPLYEFTRAVAGDRADAVMLMPPGVEPHEWDPSPQDVARLSVAKVFVYNGAGFEPWASSMIAPSMKTVDAYQASGLSGGNPHVWLDPVAVKKIVAKIAESLAEADAENAEYYRSNAANYSSRLDALDSEIREKISNFRSTKYVAFHPAYEHFDRRYGLDEVAYFEEVPGREPSAAQVARFIETAKSNNITVIFIEPSVDPTPALTIAKEINGSRVMTLDPIEIGQGADYFAVMRENVEKLKEALG